VTLLHIETLQQGLSRSAIVFLLLYVKLHYI